MTKFCVSCGHKFGKNDNFCGSCGGLRDEIQTTESKAIDLLDSLESGSRAELSVLFKLHAWSRDECDLCEWLADHHEQSEEALFIAAARNDACPDSILREMIEHFASAPGAWVEVCDWILQNPNCSRKTRALVEDYLSDDDFDEG